MFSEWCGVSWFPLPDGWWGYCCRAHDEAGLSWHSNLEFFHCMYEAGGLLLAIPAFLLVTLGLALSLLRLFPQDRRKHPGQSAGFFIGANGMDITYRVALEVATHEGIVRQAYKDSVGVWTWSVGLTNATGHDVKRYIDNPQSLEHCLRIYVWALEKYADDVREVFKDEKLTENQFAAALSFHWNTGAIRRASWVTAFKRGQYSRAKDLFMAWKKPFEIIPRRRAERDLFFFGDWSQDGTMNEYTRLTSRHTPVWGSLKKVNVEDALRAAMDQETPSAAVEVDEPEKAAEPVSEPLPNIPSNPGWVGLLIRILKGLFQ